LNGQLVSTQPSAKERARTSMDYATELSCRVRASGMNLAPSDCKLTADG
jgi:hypothetical protein